MTPSPTNMTSRLLILNFAPRIHVSDQLAMVAAVEGLAREALRRFRRNRGVDGECQGLSGLSENARWMSYPPDPV